MVNSTVRFILYTPSHLRVNTSSDSPYGIPGRLYGQMAEFDRLTNQTKYKQTLKQDFALAESANSEFSSIFQYGLMIPPESHLTNVNFSVSS